MKIVDTPESEGKKVRELPRKRKGRREARKCHQLKLQSQKTASPFVKPEAGERNKASGTKRIKANCRDG